MSMEDMIPLLWQGLLETLQMTIPATAFSYLIGMPLGILLVVTRKDHIMPNIKLNAILGTIVNFLRSIPFIILLAMLFPVTVGWVVAKTNNWNYALFIFAGLFAIDAVCWSLLNPQGTLFDDESDKEPTHEAT